MLIIELHDVIHIIGISLRRVLKTELVSLGRPLPKRSRLSLTISICSSPVTNGLLALFLGLICNGRGSGHEITTHTIKDSPMPRKAQHYVSTQRFRAKTSFQNIPCVSSACQPILSSPSLYAIISTPVFHSATPYKLANLLASCSTSGT